MVVIDVYGRIGKIKISDKLKLYISNIPVDWKEEIIEDIFQEIRQQKIDIYENIRRYGESYQTEYSVTYLKKIVQANIQDYSEYNLDSIEKCIKCLVDNMVCLFFDYADKVMYFSNFINYRVVNGININCIYSSNVNPLEKTRILANLSFRISSEFKNWKSKDEYINELKKMGYRIDNILKSENDYYKLDYIMNGIYKDNNYNQNHFLKSFSLLELVLLKTNQKTEEIDVLLIPILNKAYGNNSKEVAKLIRQMRNKIGHGDFNGFNKKAENFAKEFMKQYFFDYSEHSRLNWILLYTCCLLDDLLRVALFRQFKSRN